MELFCLCTGSFVPFTNKGTTIVHLIVFVVVDAACLFLAGL
jgi:hypothetical protein